MRSLSSKNKISNFRNNRVIFCIIKVNVMVKNKSVVNFEKALTLIQYFALIHFKTCLQKVQVKYEPCNCYCLSDCDIYLCQIQFLFLETDVFINSKEYKNNTKAQIFISKVEQLDNSSFSKRIIIFRSTGNLKAVQPLPSLYLQFLLLI